ncbi:MAG: hypothetical protein CMJ94_14880 [Planctomycetes bacterium]|nr:hypothetical protein [Planctomycetota bacterium]
MLAALTLGLAASAQLSAPGEPPEIPHGIWRAWLESPGGQLPFGLEIGKTTTGAWTASILNGRERITIQEVEWVMQKEGAIESWTLELRFPHFDSVIRAQPGLEGSVLSGEWIKTRGADAVTRMPFLARITEAERATDFLPMRFEERPAVPGGTRPALASRYEVQFESSRDPAIGEFHLLAEPEDPAAPRGVLGTFLTTTGDYRYLAGSIDAQGLRLSCFDGAHAFLFHAEQVPGRQVHGGLATLRGDFWSRESWHESWTAGPNASIQLPDPWAQVGLKPASERPDWRAIQVTQLDGMRVPLGKLGSQDAPARLLVLFGSWCPNCHDEHAYLKELYQKYAARGLAITSLGFELGGEPKRDLAQLRRYREAMKLPWEVALVASTTDKQKAAEAFPILTAVKSYPTTLFLNAQGEITAVHSGFSGPATGEAHARLRRHFEEKIEALLTAD